MGSRKETAVIDNPWAIDETLQTRLRLCTDLPSPPRIALNIIRLGEDPEASVADAIEVIRYDPALVTKILRLANSPLYARRRKVENLLQAITLLGLDRTLLMALSFSLVSSLNMDTGDGLNHSRFWRRTITAATACNILGERLNVAKKDALFLAGLLQDIGILALNKIHPDLYDSVATGADVHARFQDIERERVGVDHAEVGAWLLNHWNLPGLVVAGVGASHHLENGLPSPELESLVHCVAISSDIADIWSGEPLDDTLSRVTRKAQRLLGFGPDDMSSIIETVVERVWDVADLFEIDLGNVAPLEALADSAREVMMKRSLQNLHTSEQLKARHALLQSSYTRLKGESKLDSLTGVFNRAHFEASLNKEFQAAQTNHWPLTVMFIDLDHFKRVNDTYGHQAGDAVLTRVAQILTEHSRGDDVLCRYGGEEFIFLLPGTGEAGAREAANRILDALRTETHQMGGAEIIVTASMGVAVQGEGYGFDTATQLVKAADTVLYAAKQGARDQAVFFTPAI